MSDCDNTPPNLTAPDPIAWIEAILDLNERAKLLVDSRPLDYENPRIVALVRSVNVPEAGENGAKLQKGIGSTREWQQDIESMEIRCRSLKRWIRKNQHNLDLFKKVNANLRKKGLTQISKAYFLDAYNYSWILASLTSSEEEHSNVQYHIYR